MSGIYSFRCHAQAMLSSIMLSYGNLDLMLMTSWYRCLSLCNFIYPTWAWTLRARNSSMLALPCSTSVFYLSVSTTVVQIMLINTSYSRKLKTQANSFDFGKHRAAER